MSPTTPRKRLPAPQRREQIVTAARAVFVEAGRAGARMRDIAARAGINEALVYQHFTSKDELFEEAVVARLEETLAKLVAESGQPPAEFDETGKTMHARTLHYVRDLLAMMEEVGPLLGVVFFGDTEAAGVHLRDRIAPYLAQVRAVVEANLPSWRHHDFDPELSVQAIFGAAWFYATVARLEGRQIDRDRVAEALTTMMLEGLRSREH